MKAKTKGIHQLDIHVSGVAQDRVEKERVTDILK
jgi:hypothetical protein